jgi:hypothetical protein
VGQFEVKLFWMPIADMIGAWMAQHVLNFSALDWAAVLRA